MSPQQQTFGFDVFEMGGFTQASVHDADWHEAQRLREELRKARERAQQAERERKAREKQDRERAEREARTRNTYESPWDVLGVSAGASGKEIRSAWVRKCKEHHPDCGGSEAAMKRVNAAYNALKVRMR